MLAFDEYIQQYKPENDGAVEGPQNAQEQGAEPQKDFDTFIMQYKQEEQDQPEEQQPQQASTSAYAKNPYYGKVSEKAAKYGLDTDYVMAVIEQESGFNPKAIGPATRSGEHAAGLMQLMPGTAKDMGVRDRFDPDENLEGGIKYLRQQLDRFGGNGELALAAYNAGPGAVEKYGGIPPYQQTQAYVKKIGERYAKAKGSYQEPVKQEIAFSQNKDFDTFIDEYSYEHGLKERPEGDGLLKRTGKGLTSGVLGTVEGMAGGIEWLTGSDMAKGFADQVQEWRKELQPEQPEFYDKVASAVGSAATFFIPGFGISKGAQALSFAPKVASWFGVGSATALESMTEAGDSYRTMMEKTGDDNQASDAATKTFMLNLPLIAVTNKLGVFGDNANGFLRKIGVSMGMEGTQEGAQYGIQQSSLGEDFKVKDALESAGIGALVGGGFGGIGYALDKGQRQRPEEIVDLADEEPYDLTDEHPEFEMRKPEDVYAPYSPEAAEKLRQPGQLGLPEPERGFKARDPEDVYSPYSPDFAEGVKRPPQGLPEGQGFQLGETEEPQRMNLQQAEIERRRQAQQIAVLRDKYVAQHRQLPDGRAKQRLGQEIERLTGILEESGYQPQQQQTPQEQPHEQALQQTQPQQPQQPKPKPVDIFPQVLGAIKGAKTPDEANAAYAQANQAMQQGQLRQSDLLLLYGHRNDRIDQLRQQAQQQGVDEYNNLPRPEGQPFRGPTIDTLTRRPVSPEDIPNATGVQPEQQPAGDFQTYSQQILKAQDQDSVAAILTQVQNDPGVMPPEKKMLQFYAKTRMSELAKGTARQPQQEQPQVKQPWEMTRNEYISSNPSAPERTKQWNELKKLLNKNQSQGRREGLITSEQWINFRKKYGEPDPVGIDLFHFFSDPTGHGVIVKEGLSKAGNQHWQAVHQAIAEGKPVPKEVLAEYPDLAQRQTDQLTPADIKQALGKDYAQDVLDSGAYDKLDAIQKAGGIDIDSVNATFGEGAAKILNEKRAFIARKGGMPIDQAASDYGFDSDQQLYDAIIHYKPKKQLQQQVQQTPTQQPQETLETLKEERQKAQNRFERLTQMRGIGPTGLTPEQEELYQKINDINKQIREIERPEREAAEAAKNKVREAASANRQAEQDKAIANAPVFRKVNGWEIVKHENNYYVRDPNTKEEFYYSSSYKRAVEVAKESSHSKPPPQENINEETKQPQFSDAQLSAMLDIRKKSDHYTETGTRLSPPSGKNPAGSEHVRHLGTGSALSKFLSAIAKGASVQEATVAAKEEAQSWAKNWNEKRPKDYQTHIYESFADHIIDDAAREYANASKQETTHALPASERWNKSPSVRYSKIRQILGRVGISQTQQESQSQQTPFQPKPEQITTAHQAAAKIVKEAFGQDVVWYDSEGAENEGVQGFPLDNKTIAVSVRTRNPVASVVIHETMHQLQTKHPDLYAHLRKIAPQNYEQYVQSLFDRYESARQRGVDVPTLSDEEVESEFWAEFGGEEAAGRKLWTQLGKQDPDFFKRLVAAIKEILQDIRRRIGQTLHGNDNLERMMESEKYFENIDLARKRLAEVLAEFSRRERAGGQQIDAAADAQFSISIKPKQRNKISLEEDTDISVQERGGVHGLPDNADISNIYSIQQLRDNRVRVDVKNVSKGSYGNTYEMSIRSPKTNSVKEGNKYYSYDEERKFPKRVYYDSNIVNADLQIANDKYSWLHEYHPLESRGPNNDTMWRGISGEELQDILNTGRIQSLGAMNFDSQQGKTLFATNPSQAASYASGFAAWYDKPTFANPSYVIQVTRPDNATKNRTEELEVPGSLPIGSIEKVWEIRVGIEEPGYMDLRSEGVGRDGKEKFKEGSRSDQSQQYVVRDVTDEVLKQTTFSISAKHGSGKVFEKEERTPFSYVGRNAKGWEDLPGKFSSLYDKMERAEIDDSKARLKKTIKMLERENPNPSRLDNYLFHPSLFKAYPELKNITVTGTDKNSASYYSKSDLAIDGQIQIPRSYSHDEQLKTLIHEIQHAIQEREGFARGGSPESAKELIDENMAKKFNAADSKYYAFKNTLPEVYQAHKEMELLDLGLMEEHGIEPFDTSGRIRDDSYIRLASKLTKDERARRELAQDKYNDAIENSGGWESPKINEFINAAIDRHESMKASGLSARDAYLHLAGEIEARDTAARKDLTSDQRRQTPPYSSEDIAPEDAIVQFGQSPAMSLSAAKEKVTDDPAFREWFGNSKVVDENGEPLVVYHGTDADFNIFQIGAKGTNSNVFGSWDTERSALFFTPDKKSAQGYADQGGRTGKVMPLYLRIEDPIDMRTGPREGMLNNIEDSGLNPRYYLNKWGSWQIFENENGGYELVDFLKQHGYDGAIIDGEDGVEYLAFSPDQIKSVWNQGTWDANNPDIRFSMAGRQPTGTKETVKYIDKLDQQPNVYWRIQDSRLDIPQTSFSAWSEGEKYPEGHVSFYANLENAIDDLIGGYSNSWLSIAETILRDGGSVQLLAASSDNTLDGPEAEVLLQNPKIIARINITKQTLTALAKKYLGINSKDESSIYDLYPAKGDGIEPSHSAKFSLAGRPKARMTNDDEANAFLAKIGQQPLALKEKLVQAKDSMLDNWKLKTEQALFDKNAVFKFYDKIAGVVNAAKDGAYIAARMIPRPGQIISTLFQDGPLTWLPEGGFIAKHGGDGIENLLVEIGKHDEYGLQKFFGWRVARRAERLMNEGKEHLFTNTDIQAGLRLAKGKEKQFQVWDEKIKTVNKDILGFAEQAGVIDPKTRTLFQDDWQPFYRLIEEDQAKGPHNKRGMASQTSGIIKLKGGKERLGDPVQNLLMNWMHLTDAAIKNEATRRAIKNASAANVVKKAPYQFKPALIPGSNLRKFVKDNYGGLLESVGVDASLLDLQQLDALVKMIQMTKPAGKNVIHVLEDGKPVYYEVEDPILLRALNGINEAPWNDPVIKTMRQFKRVFTGAITIDPAFKMVNWLRDTLQTFTLSDGFVPLIDSVRGTVKLMREDPDYIAMRSAGAVFEHGYYGTTPEEAQQHIDKMFKKTKYGIDKSLILDSGKKILGFLKKLDMASENAARAQIYANMRKQGKTHFESAYAAKDIMDFGLRGDAQIIRFLTETVPFLGARIQGLHRMGRGAMENPAAFAKKGLLITAASIALYALNKDDDRYKELEEWDKDTYFHFFIGNSHYRLPKPFEVGAIWSTIPERLFDTFFGEGDAKLLGTRVLAMFRDTFSFQPPQIIGPMLEQYANKSWFTGRPIVNQGLQNLEPGAQKDPWTSETVATIGDKLNLSPKRIEALVRGYLGTLGMYSLMASDAALRRIYDYPAEPSTRLDSVPLIRRFYQEEPKTHTKYGTALYEMIKEADALHATINAYKKTGDIAKIKELVDENKPKLLRHKMLNAAEKQMGEINNRVKMIHMNPNMTAEKKRELIDKLAETKNRIAKKAYDNAKVVWQ